LATTDVVTGLDVGRDKQLEWQKMISSNNLLRVLKQTNDEAKADKLLLSVSSIQTRNGKKFFPTD
jgi:hypothetical protein